MSAEKSIDVLSTEMQGMKEQLAELKGMFTNFQTNFLRTDIYAIRQEEVISKIAKLEKDSVRFEVVNAEIKADLDKAKGGLLVIKVMIGSLTGIAAVIGALWWLR